MKSIKYPILLSFIIILSASNIYSKEPLWDKSGNWIHKASDEKFNEATIGFSYERNESPLLGYGDGSEHYPLVLLEELQNISMTLNRHFKPRYQNPSVPFSFVPYNYRDSNIRFLMRSHKFYEKFGMDKMPNIYANDFIIDGTYYLGRIKGYFFGGTIRYLSETDRKFANSFNYYAIETGGHFGYFGTKFECGLEMLWRLHCRT